MTEQNESFEMVLQDAKQQGFAEADPTLDIEGIDAAHKLAVLINLAYGRNIKLSNIYTEGISEITPLDIEFARELGYKIKLLAICRGNGEEIDARVHATLIPEGHLLSQVSGTFNAIFLQGDAVGPCMLYGKGAGMMPTASAVVSDIMDIARNVQKGISQRLLPAAAGTGALRDIKVRGFRNIQTRYYLRFSAVDKPGVVAKIAGILGRNQKAGQELPVHSHDIEGQVSIAVLQGEGEFLAKDGATLNAKPGDVLISEIAEPHGIRATSDMRVLVTIAPPI